MSYDKSTRGARELDKILLRIVCGTCSAEIWNNAIPNGVRRHIETDKCAMGAVDHLFQLGVNVMYHENMYLVVHV
jgi:hypothetical protein